MKNRTPTPRAERPALPAFDAVPRKPRHDGWTPARQVAFIEALADTGSVSSAARQVNMTPESAYYFRRAPGAEGFARAWEAALDMGVLRLKDEAFERAMHGELVPIVSGGQLLGYRRKRNDYLLMFLLRHYGVGAQGERIPNAALPAPGQRAARARAARAAVPAPTSGRTQPPLPAPSASPSAIVADFAGVPLDEEAHAQIVAALTACAARARAQGPADDPEQTHVDPRELDPEHPDALREVHTLGVTYDDEAPAEGNEDWRTLDLPDQRAAIAEAVAAITAKQANGDWDRERLEHAAAREARAEKEARIQAFLDSGRPVGEWEG